MNWMKPVFDNTFFRGSGGGGGVGQNNVDIILRGVVT